MALIPVNLIPVQYYQPNQSLYQPLSGMQNPNDIYVKTFQPDPVIINNSLPLANAVLISVNSIISWINPLISNLNLKTENTAGKSVFKIEQSASPYPLITEIDSIPDISKLDKSANIGFDVRGADMNKFDLSNQKELLRYTIFDTNTKWPSEDKMPKDFNPQEVLENNKNPGLGVREMHKKGYTGKGVTVAIIDQPLNIDHNEFKDRIVNYQEIGYPQKTIAEIHGSAVTSILGGKTVGVAPDCKIVYFAANCRATQKGDSTTQPNKNYTEAIKRIIEMNKSLPEDQKISVISISWAFNENSPDYREALDTIKKAEDSGIFVVWGRLDEKNNMNHNGLNRDPQGNPEDPKSYSIGAFYQGRGDINAGDENNFLVPMDHRTTASPGGSNEYTHYPNGGMSWATPYVAGMYAVAKQIKPSIAPQEFWKIALETGTPLLSKTGKITGKIINPLKLTESLEQKKQ